MKWNIEKKILLLIHIFIKFAIFETLNKKIIIFTLVYNEY
jgi:hypothetical protein